MWMSSLFNLLQYQVSWCNGYHSCRKPRFKSLFRDWLSKWLTSPWVSSIRSYNSRIRGKALALRPTESLGILTGMQGQSFFDSDTGWRWMVSTVSQMLSPWGSNLLDMVLLNLQKNSSCLKTWNKVMTLQSKPGCNYLIAFSFQWNAAYLQWPTEYNGKRQQKCENYEGTVKPVELEPRSNESLLISENSSSPKNIQCDNRCKITCNKKHFTAEREMETINSVENSLLKYLMFCVHII
jgi:hypothetical protein